MYVKGKILQFLYTYGHYHFNKNEKIYKNERLFDDFSGWAAGFVSPTTRNGSNLKSENM